MMVLHRAEERIEHTRFAEVARFVQPGDLFVLNDTRVVLAREFSDDGAIEFLLETGWKRARLGRQCFSRTAAASTRSRP